MVGVCIVVLVHNIPYKYFRVFPVFLLPLSTLLLIFVMGMGLITGDRVNGAARWMTFFGIQFQPSELAKMAVNYCHRIYSIQVSGRRQCQSESI